MTSSTVLELAARHQVVCYLGSIILGGLIGLAVPNASAIADPAITVSLIALLFVTFLDVPFEGVRNAFLDTRFLAAVMGVNFILVPLVVAAIHVLVPLDDTVVVAALIVLLAPCIDYVLVFTKLAGGAHEHLLALTPVLMLAQIVLLPVYLWLILGDDAAAAMRPGPFLQALVLFIIVPLLAAVLVRLLARTSSLIRGGAGIVSNSMVGLMMLTLAVISAAEVPIVVPYVSELGLSMAVFAGFALVMTGLGWLTTRVLGLDSGPGRALIFTAVTRNSLVMLPLVRAITSSDLGPAVVVTQTVVELLVMVILVRVVRWIVPDTVVSENR